MVNWINNIEARARYEEKTYLQLGYLVIEYESTENINCFEQRIGPAIVVENSIEIFTIFANVRGTYRTFGIVQSRKFHVTVVAL